MLKIFSICGSPRKGGNSEHLLDEALSALTERNIPYRKICLSDLIIYPCNACYGCAKSGRCVLRDDLTKLYDEVERSTHIIIAAPIFFNGLPAQLKAFVDRFQAFYARYFILKKKKPPLKKGYFLAVSARREKNTFKGAVSTIDVFLRSICGRLEKSLCIGGVEEKGGILKLRSDLRKAYSIGREIAAA